MKSLMKGSKGRTCRRTDIKSYSGPNYSPFDKHLNIGYTYKIWDRTKYMNNYTCTDISGACI